MEFRFSRGGYGIVFVLAAGPLEAASLRESGGPNEGQRSDGRNQLPNPGLPDAAIHGERLVPYCSRGETGVIPCGCCDTVSSGAFAARVRPMRDHHATGAARRAAATIRIAVVSGERR